MTTTIALNTYERRNAATNIGHNQCLHQTGNMILRVTPHVGVPSNFDLLTCTIETTTIAITCETMGTTDLNLPTLADSSSAAYDIEDLLICNELLTEDERSMTEIRPKGTDSDSDSDLENGELSIESPTQKNTLPKTSTHRVRIGPKFDLTDDEKLEKRLADQSLRQRIRMAGLVGFAVVLLIIFICVLLALLSCFRNDSRSYNDELH
jgi:hypothetical protein